MTTPVSIDFLVQTFSRIYQNLDPEFLPELEQEMRKIVPAPESEVFMTFGYGDYDNTISITVMVSIPLPSDQVTGMKMDTIFPLWLLKANTDKFPVLFDIIQRMEKKGGERYYIAGIPVVFNPRINDYCFHFTITKK